MSKMNDNRAKIKALRETTNMTYNQIAKELGLSVTYVQVLNGSDGRRGGDRPAIIRENAKLSKSVEYYAKKDLPPKIVALILEEPIEKIRSIMRELGYVRHRSRSGENEDLYVQGQRRCGRCKEIKPLSGFNKHKSGPHGLLGTCKICRLIPIRAAKAKAEEGVPAEAPSAN